MTMTTTTMAVMTTMMTLAMTTRETTITATTFAMPARRSLLIALALITSYMIAEVIGGLFSGSLALLADAGHMLTDAAAIAMALIAMWIGPKARLY